MKKALLFVVAICLATMGLKAQDCQNGPYALYVNGSSVAVFEDAGMSPDQLPQLHAVAQLAEGDVVQFCNTSCDARWFPTNIETGGDVDGSANFAVSGESAVCNVAGCYNFWWKQKFEDDRLYIGTDGECGDNGGDKGGDNGGNGGDNGGECQNGPYALYVNGASVSTFEDAGMSPDELPQLHATAQLAEGDIVQFCNTSCDARWFPTNIETGGDVDGSANFAVSGESAVCNVAGCYNFWWKQKFEDDRLYIGTDGECDGNGGNNGGNGGSQDQDGGVWYYKGWINQKDVEPSEETAFTGGIANMISSDVFCNVMLVYQVHGQPGQQYMTIQQGTSPESPADFKLWDAGDKMLVPPGTEKLYLYKGLTEGTVTLSITELPGRTLMGANQGGGNGENPGDNPGGKTDALDDISNANISVCGSEIIATDLVRIINALGQDVTALNGSLSKGMYIVVTKTATCKIML